MTPLTAVEADQMRCRRGGLDHHIITIELHFRLLIPECNSTFYPRPQPNTEEVLLAYFFNVEKHFAASSMWTKYSMLKSMLKVHRGIDISKKYKTKKAKILERNQIEEFLKKAPDVEYLQVKVALILGVAGACRCNELIFLDISDVQDKGSYLYVLIPDTKTNISRSFTVMEEACSVNAVEMCRKYISLRPKAAGRRFFLRYVDGKCTTQHVGINTIPKTFSKVASFLGLPDPESFTGHGMRRSSATFIGQCWGRYYHCQASRWLEVDYGCGKLY
ncbi:hypothetical protein NQ315_000108 [Exocentrus adspersus]|uniref:Tyr recombinase domain-containing protein n=1 Tax=Exocentrus adspersus TaxID=1586481 RepID=A0AAV8VU32_9CUCU|nr:hypothetical protein NQ315_000108 [Exocentrus adspersus]